jgi:putative MATE family efflux protein
MFKKFRALFGSQDMTQGKILICLLKFSIPLLISSFAQMLYTTADRMIVGKYVGDGALAAVSASMSIQNLFLVFFVAIGSAVTIMVSQYFGAKDHDNLGMTVGNSITLIAIVSVVVTAISAPLTTNILNLLGTNEDIFEMSRVYLFILFLGAAGNGFYNVLSGILRGLGDSIFPLFVLVGTVVLNVGLDIWFVAEAGLNMGIAGAAWATIISQILSSCVCVLKIVRIRATIGLSKKSLRLRGATVRQITRLGLPTGIQMAIMFLSNIVTQPAIMLMGSSVFAAMGATMSVDGFAVLPCQAFSMAASTFTGQNIGAGNMERVKQGSKSVFLICLAFTVVMVIAVQLFGPYMFALFTDTQSVIDMGMGFIRLMIPAYLAMTVNMSFSGVMRGAGDAMGTMWISVLINVILKVPLTFLIISLTKSAQWPNGAPNSMFLAMLCSMLIGMVITMAYYRSGRWRNKSIVPVKPGA